MKTTEEKILEWMSVDRDIQIILHIINQLNLKESWLCAGLVRNYIWNVLSDKPGFDPETDVDIIFFNKDTSWEETMALEQHLKTDYPSYRWEVRNQAYMHVHNPNTRPYSSSKEAMSKYPEKCTAIGIRLNKKGELELFCPYGLESITSFEIRPTPHFKSDQKRMEVYRNRLQKKDWFQKWPQLTIYEE